MKVRITLYFFVLIVAQLMGQSYSTIYEFNDPQIYQFTDADVYPLNDGHVMALHTIYKPGSDREFDHLVFHEFDSCGLIDSRVMEISQLFGLSRISDFIHRGDSLYIIARGTSSPGIYPYSEGVFMTLHRETLIGTYRYFRFTQGAIFYNLDFMANGGFVISGFSSSTMAQPSRYMSMQLDAGYKIINSKQYAPAGTVSTDIKAIPGNKLLIRTSQNLFLVDEDYNVLWHQVFDRPIAGERSIVLGDGIIIPLFGWYGDSELQIIKLDFDGNIIWTSARLNEGIEYDVNARLIDAKDGTMIVVSQSYEFNEFEGDIQISRLTLDGQIIDQYAVATHQDSTAFEWMREATYAGGAIWVMMTNTLGRLKLYRIDDMFDICGAKDFSFSNTEHYTWLDTGAFIHFNPLNIITGQYAVHTDPINISISNLCKPAYPLYDLMPEDTLLCNNNFLIVNLDTIPESVFWSDGSTEKVRVIHDVGIYSYGYGPCQTEFAESITVGFYDCSCRVYIPSAFSPNDDGINDYFRIYSPCDLGQVSSMKIYDRWGSKVFESSPDRLFWDGVHQGKELNAGTYIYVYTYQDVGILGHSELSLDGEVQLIR